MSRQAACPDCDVLMQLPVLRDGERAVCPRCDATIARGGRSLLTLLLLCISGVWLWIASLLSPMLVLDVNGVQQSVSLWRAAMAMIDQQEWLLAMLVAMTTVIAPVLHLGAMLYLLVPVVNRKRPWAVGWVFRALHANQSWLMLEVFFLGVVVTAVKLSDMAQVTPGWSLFSFMALMFIMTAVSVLFDADVYWRAVEKCPSQP